MTGTKSYLPHSKWQGLEPSIPLTLLTVEYGPEILRGEDADGLTQGAGAELSCNSVIPGDSSDIQRESHFQGPIKGGVNQNRNPPGTKT